MKKRMDDEVRWYDLLLVQLRSRERYLAGTFDDFVDGTCLSVREIPRLNFGFTGWFASGHSCDLSLDLKSDLDLDAARLLESIGWPHVSSFGNVGDTSIAQDL